MQFTITTILALAASVSALGINCRGSSQCSQGTGEVSRKLTGYINQLADDRWVDNGVQIACVREPHAGGADGAICAFMQGTGGAPAKSLKSLAQDLVDHGCKLVYPFISLDEYELLILLCLLASVEVCLSFSRRIIILILMVFLLSTTLALAVERAGSAFRRLNGG
jgi:hypothetical protein